MESSRHALLPIYAIRLTFSARSERPLLAQSGRSRRDLHLLTCACGWREARSTSQLKRFGAGPKNESQLEHNPAQCEAAFQEDAAQTTA